MLDVLLKTKINMLFPLPPKVCPKLQVQRGLALRLGWLLSPTVCRKEVAAPEESSPQLICLLGYQSAFPASPHSHL